MLIKFLVSFNFKSCPHELCLHVGEFHGKTIILIRQVGDFAIAIQDKKLVDSFLEVLDSNLKQKKREGLISSFDGLDVHQSSHCTKISCKSHFKKNLKRI